MFSTLHKRFVRGTIIKPEAPSISLPPTQTLPPLPAAITPDKNNSTAAAERHGMREVLYSTPTSYVHRSTKAT